MTCVRFFLLYFILSFASQFRAGVLSRILNILFAMQSILLTRTPRHASHTKCSVKKYVVCKILKLKNSGVKSWSSYFSKFLRQIIYVKVRSNETGGGNYQLYL